MKNRIQFFILLLVLALILTSCSQSNLSGEAKKKQDFNQIDSPGGGYVSCHATCGNVEHSATCQSNSNLKCSCDCSDNPVCSCGLMVSIE